jgi:hypothetical protein
MNGTNIPSDKKIVTRRGFLKAILPGLFAAGVVRVSGASAQPAAGSYGNGAYGGVSAESNATPPIKP